MDINLLTDKVREFRAEGLDWERIEERLKNLGVPAEQRAESMMTVKKEIRAKFRNRGMALIALGSVLCFLSMLFTFMFGHNYFVLYGLTLLGVTIAFAGLVYVMG